VRRAIPASAVAVLVVVGTITARTNASASPSDTYRTTAVTTGSVEQRLNLTGSVQRVNQVSRSFAVPGIVSSVAVAVGDTVRAGQTLATLDPKPLTSAVTNAEAALAQAKATLESDQTTTTTAATPTSSTTATNATLSRTTPTTGARVTSPSGRSGASANQALAGGAAARGENPERSHGRPAPGDCRPGAVCAVLFLRAIIYHGSHNGRAHSLYARQTRPPTPR